MTLKAIKFTGKYTDQFVKSLSSMPWDFDVVVLTNGYKLHKNLNQNTIFFLKKMKS